MECNAADERAKLLASEVIGLEEKVAFICATNYYLFIFKDLVLLCQSGSQEVAE